MARWFTGEEGWLTLKGKRRRFAIVGAVLIVLSLYWGYVALVRAKMGLPIRTPEHAAEKLLFDKSFGNYAIEPCIAYGDEIIPWLANKSEDFARIYLVNGGRVAKVLQSIPSSRCETLLRSLVQRDCNNPEILTKYSKELPSLSPRPNCLLTKAMAAYCLARHGKLERNAVLVGFLIECVKAEHLTPVDEVNFSFGCQSYAALTLGFIGALDAVPVLIAELPEVKNGASENIIDALGLLGDKAAVGPLMSYLAAASRGERKNGPGEKRRAPWAFDRIFRALILLEDYDALDLMIEYVVHDPSSDSWSLAGLRAMTGVDFGNDVESWRRWWKEHKGGFRLPAAAMARLREEASNEERPWLVNGLTGFSLLPVRECFSSLSAQANLPR